MSGLAGHDTSAYRREVVCREDQAAAQVAVGVRGHGPEPWPVVCREDEAAAQMAAGVRFQGPSLAGVLQGGPGRGAGGSWG